MRWPIEACFRGSNGELGMDHDELRFWRGWHHHLIMVILTHHFLVRLQRRLDPREGVYTEPVALSNEATTTSVSVPPTIRWNPQAAAPSSLKGLSLAEIRMLLCAVLPQPIFDAPAALALLAYRRRRKAAAYRSHRKRTIRRLIERMEHVSL